MEQGSAFEQDKRTGPGVSNDNDKALIRSLVRTTQSANGVYSPMKPSSPRASPLVLP